MKGDVGVWKVDVKQGRHVPKGRQLDLNVQAQVESTIATSTWQRDLLIEYLHLLQDKFGYLSNAMLKILAEKLAIGEAEVYEVASFYSHFDIVSDGEQAPAPITIRVCNSLSCQMQGSDQLATELQLATDPHQVRVMRAPCMGRCQSAPTAVVGKRHLDHATLNDVLVLLDKNDFTPIIPDYQPLSYYLADGGYQQYLSIKRGDRDTDEVEQMMLEAGLRGVGGAGFPSGKKWQFVRAEQGPRLMAVNADEGEPGTFKDRFYLEKQPHIFLEGMLIAAHAVEAEHIYIYVRDEYPAAIAILKQELKALVEQQIIAADFVEIRRGAGAYICGEESAMIESIEGKRGLPRHRPPFVAQKGLFGLPTLVHNVETLYWVAKLCYQGVELFTAVERNGRKGLRSYSVSGRVKQPGLYLLPAGSTILDIIDAAGGMNDGHLFKAYQPGGPSSGILPASLNDVPLDFDTLQPHGSFIGSAAVIVLSDQDSVRDAAINMLTFFDHESCGQCTPCRVGCEKALKLMQQPKWDTALLGELCEVMTDASICGLGQAAPNPIKLVIKHFGDEV